MLDSEIIVKLRASNKKLTAERDKLRKSRQDVITERDALQCKVNNLEAHYIPFREQAKRLHDTHERAATIVRFCEPLLEVLRDPDRVE